MSFPYLFQYFVSIKLTSQTSIFTNIQ